eukprot:1219554-Prymnesium_polylepis.1
MTSYGWQRKAKGGGRRPAAHELGGRARLPQAGNAARAAALISSVIARSTSRKLTDPVSAGANALRP